MFRASAVLVLVLAAVTLLGPDISAQDPKAVEESQEAAADLAGGTTGAGQTVPPCPEPDEEDYVTPVPVIGLGFPGADGKPAPFEDKFFFVMNDRFRLYLKNDAQNNSGDPCPKASGMKVEITARGFRPMLTLADDVIILKPQESTTVPVKQTRIGLQIEKHGEDDLLGGMEIRVRAMPEGRDSPILFDEKLRVYRLYDVMDDKHVDRRLEFADTAFVEKGKAVERIRRLGIAVNHEDDLEPTLEVTSDSYLEHFKLRSPSGPFHEIIFEPKAREQDLKGTLKFLRSSGGKELGTVELLGDGDFQEIWIDSEGLAEILHRIPRLEWMKADDYAEERAVTATPEQCRQIASLVVDRCNALLNPVSQGVQIYHSLGGAGRGSVTDGVQFDNWRRGAARVSNPDRDPIARSLYQASSGKFYNFIDNKWNGRSIPQLLLRQRNINRAEAAFRLSETLNEAARGAVDIYLVKFFIQQFADRRQLVLSVAKAIVHEFGHQVGLVHTAAGIGTTVGIQSIKGRRVTLDAPLDWGNENPNLLKTFTAFTRDTGFQVTGYDRRRNTLILDKPVPPGVYDDEDDTIYIGGDVAIGGDGSPGTDIMAQGFDPAGKKVMQLTEPGYRIGLGLDWTLDEADDVIEYFRHHGKRSYAGNWDDEKDPRTFYETLHPPAIEFGGPVLWIVDEKGRTVLDADFGTVEIDPTKPPPSVTRKFTAQNLGEIPLEARSPKPATLAPFAPRRLPPILRLKPGKSRDFTITWTPKSGGTHEVVLPLIGNSLGGDWEIRLRGQAESTGGEARLEIANNNVGGRTIGEGPSRHPGFAKLSNAGKAPLEVRSISVLSPAEGKPPFVIQVPQELAAGSPITLDAGASLALDLEFEPQAPGLVGATLIVETKDSARLEQAIVGTGLAPDGRAKRGRNFASLHLQGQPEETLRTITNDEGSFAFTAAAETDFHFALFDPASHLISHEYSTTAKKGEPTRFGSTSFRASTAADTDGDHLPDDIEFAIGSDPENRDTDGDGTTDFEALRSGGDPLGRKAASLRKTAPPKRRKPAPLTSTDRTATSTLVEECVAALKKDAPFTAKLETKQDRGRRAMFAYRIAEPLPNALTIFTSAKAFLESKGATLDDSMNLPGLMTVTGKDMPLGARKVRIAVIYAKEKLIFEIR